MIDATRLDEVFRDSLFRDEEVHGGEVPEGAVLVEGVAHSFAFHPDRLRSHDAEVAAMLAQLPAPFHEKSGGGWSFLNAPFVGDPDDLEQWGEQSNAEQLLCMGVGLGRVKSQLPRDMWAILPGGVPYYVVYEEPRQ